MKQKRFQVYIKEDFSFKLVQSFHLWQEAVDFAYSQQRSGKQSTYLIDVLASSHSEDVFRIDSSGNPVATGHLARSLYKQLKLSPVTSLAVAGVIEPLEVTGAIMIIKPLSEAVGELRAFRDSGSEIMMSAELGILAPPFSRRQQSDNDVVLMVYCNEVLIATAVFSRHVEDHRFPCRQSELCYELSLHTVFVEPQFRGLGIATSLANTIVNIARKDMKHLHQVLAVANIQLKPWFSALALTAGGEAICDILSEAFVEMNDDVIEELMDHGLPISYQDPVISVESMA